jgi:uncharacterized protein (DUF58 family)
MLTFRSSLIVSSMVMLLALSIIDRREVLALASLSLVLWIWMEWLLFKSVTLVSQNRWKDCLREIDGQSVDRVTMVTDRDYKIVLKGSIPAAFTGYRLLIQDTAPDTFYHLENAFVVVDVQHQESFEISYTVATPICGQVHFTGIRIEISDYWGFFRTEIFVPLDQQVTVLPFLIRPQTTVSVLKHNNLQQHIGHHRHRSAGISSELLGIRDYRVGDPPRTIAWKPTARLGKVMTCEFENEVPVRATLIVDLAAYQFQGRPGASAADRAIVAAASIAKLLLADRDPVAATLITSSQSHRIKHGGGERQLSKLLQYLMAASDPNPPLHKFPIDYLVEVVFDNANRTFPHLFDELFNRSPTRPAFFRPSRGRKRRIRSAMAIVLEHLLDLEPGTSTRLQYDDHEMGNACLNYVRKYSVVSNSTTISLDAPRYNPAHWRFERQRMTQSVCDHLTEARSRAQDNELFVIISPEPIDRMGNEFVESAVQTAVAARHRVIYVAPESPRIQDEIGDPVAARILSRSVSSDLRNVESDFRTSLRTLGAAFSRIDDPALMQLVATEVGLLQSGKSRGRTLRAR